MDECLKRELAVIKAWEIKYGADEFHVMDSLMESHGYYGNWSEEIVGDDNWEEIEKMAGEIYKKMNDYIEGH